MLYSRADTRHKTSTNEHKTGMLCPPPRPRPPDAVILERTTGRTCQDRKKAQAGAATVLATTSQFDSRAIGLRGEEG